MIELVAYVMATYSMLSGIVLPFLIAYIVFHNQGHKDDHKR